jgi:hypothetical protein
LEKSDGVFLYPYLCGYFAIISSEKMEAKDAIGLYKNRDASEKVFRAYKLYLELLQQKTKNKKAPKSISRKRKSIQN